MKTIALLTLLLLLAACVTTSAARPLPEGPVRIGQTARVGGPTVKPLAVIEDSRCPANVQCVWAGRVVVRTEVGTGQGKRVMELTLGQPVHVGDGMLTLRQVTPGKRQGKPIGAGSYRFTFDYAGSI